MGQLFYNVAKNKFPVYKYLKELQEGRTRERGQRERDSGVGAVIDAL